VESWAWLGGAIASALIGLGTFWIGARLRRRLGLPATAVDQEIQDQELRLRQALKDAEARCQDDLTKARGDLDIERQRTTQLRTDLDEEKLRTDRLVQRILKLERANGSSA